MWLLSRLFGLTQFWMISKFLIGYYVKISGSFPDWIKSQFSVEPLLLAWLIVGLES